MEQRTDHRERLYAGISRAAWGYFFLYFDINIGTVTILPDFAAMLLFFSAIGFLEEDRRDLSLLRPLASILTVWYLAVWGASWAGISLERNVMVIGLLMNVLSMYFHFQLMTDFAALAHRYVPDDSGLEGRILQLRTFQTIVLTVFTVLLYLQDTLPAGLIPGFRSGVLMVTVLMGFAALVTGICLMAALFSLRRRI